MSRQRRRPLTWSLVNYRQVNRPMSVAPRGRRKMVQGLQVSLLQPWPVNLSLRRDASLNPDVDYLCALCMNGNLEKASLCAGCCTLLFFWVHVSVWSHAFFPVFLRIAWHDDITMSLCTALLISLENECLALTNKADQLVFLMFMLYWICAHFQLGDTWGMFLERGWYFWREGGIWTSVPWWSKSSLHLLVSVV